jgi:hypothetical protein
LELANEGPPRSDLNLEPPRSLSHSLPLLPTDEHFAIQYLPAARHFYEKKAAQRHPILAMKALSHKIARACYYVMRDQVPFDEKRLFS